jgi:hypothetical protein
MEHSKYGAFKVCYKLWMLHSKFVPNFECLIPSLEQTLKKLWRLHSKFGTNFEETLKASFQVCKKLWRNSEGFIPSL